MTKVTFFVEIGTQSPIINKMLRSADLADGAVVQDGSGFNISVKWKDGEVVDAPRIAKTQQNLRTALESQGYCVLGIIQKT